MTRRLFPREIAFDTPGEAETWDCLGSEHAGEAIDSAEITGMKFDELNEETQWFMRAWETEIVVALEQCCDAGHVLPREIREARLHAFQLRTRIAAETFLREVPPEIGERVLPFIYWFVRIERAKRTGSPEFNRRRSTMVVDV